ncbi:MAG: sigma-70 family RNA polymerase sigma factor [Clostridia bacterium]|nr:sigma-70 family RNA polymerase sigma factor [Clostridia bacterium]
MGQESFDAIYQSYFDPVYRYALSLSGDPHAAEEITQETFFKALRSLHQFRGDSSMKSWLCAIAKNLYLSEQRKKKPQPLDDASALADPGPTPEEALLRQDESMRIHQLLHRLDEPYREVFTLRSLGQLSFRNIGALFGKSENWACVVYHRARTKIKNEMEA